MSDRVPSPHFAGSRGSAQPLRVLRALQRPAVGDHEHLIEPAVAAARLLLHRLCDLVQRAARRSLPPRAPARRVLERLSA